MQRKDRQNDETLSFSDVESTIFLPFPKSVKKTFIRSSNSSITVPPKDMFCNPSSACPAVSSHHNPQSSLLAWRSAMFNGLFLTENRGYRHLLPAVDPRSRYELPRL